MMKMMNNYDITIRTRRLGYNLSINNKITFILGDSGIGKTTMCGLLKKSLDDPNIKVKSDIKIQVIEYLSYVDISKVIDEANNTLFILDENCQYLKKYKDYFVNIMLKDEKNLFILISRNKFDGIPADSSSLCTFEFDKKTNTNILVPYYKSTALYKKTLIDRIITEDSKSGNEVMLRYIGKPCMPVEDANGHKGGRTKFPDFIIRNKIDGVSMAVYDSLSSVYLEQSIRDAVIESGTHWILFHPKSIEKYILDSPLCKNIVGDTEAPITEIYQEKWYEDKLKEVLPLGYNKSSTSLCIMKECNEVNNIKCKDCPNRNNSNKRELIIHGDLKHIAMRNNEGG